MKLQIILFFCFSSSRDRRGWDVSDIATDTAIAIAMWDEVKVEWKQKLYYIQSFPKYLIFVLSSEQRTRKPSQIFNNISTVYTHKIQIDSKFFHPAHSKFFKTLQVIPGMWQMCDASFFLLCFNITGIMNSILIYSQMSVLWYKSLNPFSELRNCSMEQ